MTDQGGLVCAYHVDAAGKPHELTFDEVKKIREKPSGPGWVWVHMDLDDAPTKTWVGNYKGMLGSVAEALTSLRTRPRSYVFDRGLLLILRGVNMNVGAKPEDMLSVRIWMNDKIVITTRREKLMAIDAIRQDMRSGAGPKTPSQLLIRLAHGLIDRMTDTVELLDEQISKLEDQKNEDDAKTTQLELQKIRSQSITLLRHIGPQKPAFEELLAADNPFLDKEQHGSLRIIAARITADVDELNAVRDRAVAMNDAITAAQTDQMNRAMYLLAIVTAIFLPLTLFTGLLGINVGGMPGATWLGAFWFVLFIMVVMGGATYYLMKRLKLI